MDTATGRAIAIGRCGALFVMVPFEQDDDRITPVTIHTTSRQQINFRVKTGRFAHE